jgi:hypothetical protein
VAGGPYTAPRLIRWPIVIGVLGLVGYVFLIAGLAVGKGSDAGNVTSAGLTAPGSVVWFRTRPGDCFNQSRTTSITDVEVLACSRPHDAQVFSTYQLKSLLFPGPTRAKRQAERGCSARLRASGLNVNADHGHLQLRFLYPDTIGGWFSLDRRVVCLVADQSGAKLVGSAMPS